MAEAKPRKPAAKPAEVLVAVESFIAPGGREVLRGQLVSASDPVVKGREALFQTPDERVEQATAAPGEIR